VRFVARIYSIWLNRYVDLPASASADFRGRHVPSSSASTMPPHGPIDQERVREFALALPETEEHSHFGRPDLRVKGKIFATLPEDGSSVNLKATPVDLDALVAADPVTFKDVWGGRWVGVDLARVDLDLLQQLIVDAWRLTAPKRLAATMDDRSVMQPTKAAGRDRRSKRK
jgi:hypothetical protein